MAEVAVIAAVASIAGTAGASVMKGMGQKAGMDAQAMRAERAATFGKLQAEQSDLKFREELNTTLGNIEVIRAAAKIDPNSPTSAALMDRQRTLSDRQRMTAGLNIQSQIDQDLADASYLRQSGDFALQMGFLDAGTKIAGAVGKAYAPTQATG